MVKVSTSNPEIRGLIPACELRIFPGRVIPFSYISGVPDQGPCAPQGSQSETLEVKPTFEVCTTDILDSMTLPTSANVLKVDRRSKF